MTDFRIRVVVDPGPAVAGTKKVENQLRRTQGAADNLRRVLLRTFAGIGLTVGIAGSIRLLANYSQAMSTVQAVTGATAEEFERLNARAQDLGRNTRFTATQAAEGMVLLARAGFTAEESLVAVEGTLKLAQAGGLGLAEAANVAANSLRGFRLEVDDTGRVVDVLALAANSANTNVAQLGEGLKFVAPIAAGLNISLEQTTAAVAKLSDSGLQATLAGTGLRRVLSELESPSQKTAGILSDLELAADQVRVSQVGLVAALKALKEAGLDTGQALEIFGDRGGPAFEILSSNIPAVEEMTTKLENAGGTADRVAQIMDDNLNGALLRLLSAFQGLILAIGDSGGFTTLEGAANSLANGINVLTDSVDAFTTALTVVTAAILVNKLATIELVAAEGAAAAVTLGNVKVSELLTVAQLRLAGANLTAFKSFKALGALKIPPVFLLAAVAAASYIAIQKLTEGVKDYKAALDIANGADLSGLSEFGVVTQRLKVAEGQLKTFNDRLNEGKITQEQYDTATKGLLGRIAMLQAQQEKLAKNTDKARMAAQEQAKQEDRLNAGFERSIKGLNEEARLLGLANRERDIQAQVLKEIAAIQEEGGPELIGRQLEELEAAIRRNQALREEADALDAIKGPQEQFIQRLQVLQRLQDQGRITAEEFQKAVAELVQANSDLDLSNLQLPEGLSADVDLSGTLAQIQALVAAEQERAKVEAERASILNDIKGPEDELLRRQVILMNLYDEGKISLDEYNKAIEETNAKLMPYTEEQQRLHDVLESIKGPQEEVQQRIMDLDTLLAQGAITLQEYNAEMDKLREKSDKVGTSFGEGITSGLEKIQEKMMDIASVTEAVLVNAFNSAEDALVEFATTGKFSFKEFAASILKDIARVIARLLILQAFQAATGTGGGGAPNAFGQLLGIKGKASGGDFEANQSMIVGEKGPELVRFGRPGNVTPADQTKQLLAATGNGGGGAPTVNVAAPEVKLQVVNVTSPEDARSAMDTSEGGKVILNQVRSNRAAMRKELGIG